MTWDIKWDWLKQQNETILSTSKSPFSWAIWWHHLDYICREPWAPNLHLWHPAGVLVQSTTNDPTRNENGSAISWKQRKIQLKVVPVTRVQLATGFLEGWRFFSQLHNRLDIVGWIYNAKIFWTPQISPGLPWGLPSLIPTARQFFFVGPMILFFSFHRKSRVWQLKRNM